MKRVALFILLVLLFFPCQAKQSFKCIDQWKFDEIIAGTVWHSVVDNNGHLVVAFFKTGLRLIKPDEMIAFAPFGEGPNEVKNFEAVLPYNDNIAITEHQQKTKLFTKKNGTYVSTESIWFKRGLISSFIISSGVYVKNRWFFTGLGELEGDNEYDHFYSLNVYDRQRNPIKRLLEWKSPKSNNFYHQMKRHIVSYKAQVFVVSENQPQVAVISSDDVKLIKKVTLEVPAFYKKMPEDFYRYKNGEMVNPKKYFLDLERWQTSYSRIAKVVLAGNRLVLSIRTCDKKQKLFALLFYNADTFKLEQVLYTDDFLLAAREGKYYFYANGEPARDESADKCIIKICQLSTDQ